MYHKSFCKILALKYHWLWTNHRSSFSAKEIKHSAKKSEEHLLLFFNWRIISLQCHVSFCCTTRWISYRSTWIPSLLGPPSHALIPPLEATPERGAEFPALDSSLLLFSTWSSVHVNATRSICPPLPSPSVPTRPFPASVSLFLPWK